MSELGNYQLWEEVDRVTSFKHGLEPETPEYFTWLAGLKSFHFTGEHGHFTARQESRGESDKAYWSAYRKHDHKQLRRYLGPTAKLSIATLEDAARRLTDKVSSQPPKEKTPRKRPEKREILYARIEIRDRTIKQKDQEIEALNMKLEEQKTGMLKMQKRILQLENQLRSKI